LPSAVELGNACIYSDKPPGALDMRCLSDMESAFRRVKFVVDKEDTYV